MSCFQWRGIVGLFLAGFGTVGPTWAAGPDESLGWAGLRIEDARVVLQDEFNGETLDRSKWCTRYQHSGGPALQVQDPECLKFGTYGNLDYLNREQQRYVDINREGRLQHRLGDGILRLVATRTLPGPYVKYESAMIRSKQEFRPSDTTGYLMMARVRLPAVKGTWPAFWIAPGIDAQQKTAWPPEIDIFEGALNTSSDPATSVKLGAQAQNWNQQGVAADPVRLTHTGPGFDPATRRYRQPTSLRNRWIEFAAVWRSSSVCYYIDRTKVACEDYRWIDNQRKPAPAGPLMLNLGIGGEWAGADGIADEDFPTSFDIDYVRIYEFKGS